MKDGICPKCQSDEILEELQVKDSRAFPLSVEIQEPEPADRPFFWLPDTEKSQFQAYICGACGYTEFYTVKFQELNEKRRKGYRSS